MKRRSKLLWLTSFLVVSIASAAERTQDLVVGVITAVNGDTIEVNGEPRIIPGLYTQVKDSIFNLYHQSLLEEASGIGLTYTEDKRNALQKKIESIESGAAMADLEAAIYRKEKQTENNV